MFEPNKGLERRQFKRARYIEPVGLQIIKPEKTAGCLSADLSEGGLRLKVTDYITPGTELALKVQLENFQVYEFIGRVAWAEKDRFNERYQIGVNFEDNDQMLFAREKIYQFLNTN